MENVIQSLGVMRGRSIAPERSVANIDIRHKASVVLQGVIDKFKVVLLKLKIINRI